MRGHGVLTNRRALALLGCLSLQRFAAAGLPVVLVVLSADLRGYSAAATIQGLRVIVGTLSAPFRARLLDRIGRERVIIPQTVVASLLSLILGAVLITKSVPLPLVLLAAGAATLASPSTDAVIRTLWRTLGTDEQQVRTLHSYDSILEEVGYLAGPFLASVLMLSIGQKPALIAFVCATVCGYVLVLTSRDARSALRCRKRPSAREPEPIRIDGKLRQFVRTLAGPIASRELQRIVLPLILMGSVFGVVGILAPALCAQHGRSSGAGFLLATISLGGIIGALTYSRLRTGWTLRRRHAALGLIFSAPLLLGFLASSPWTLGVLLVVGGLAVTPLYINAYLMMDADIPEDVIHEANTWVPVGNNVGYVIGITLAASLLGRHNTQGALVTITVLSAALATYSIVQLRGTQSGPPAITALDPVASGI